jgi:hypothetical protein
MKGALGRLDDGDEGLLGCEWEGLPASCSNAKRRLRRSAGGGQNSTAHLSDVSCAIQQGTNAAL